MKTIGVFFKPKIENINSIIEELSAYLKSKNISVLSEPNSSNEKIINDSDFLVVFGGDGTILSTARKIQKLNKSNKKIPVIGINSGTFGFLTEFNINQIQETLDLLIENKLKFTERSMLESSICDSSNKIIQEKTVLNDIVVTKQDIARIMNFSVYCNSNLVANIRADGLIVSTPTGSTAYSLAAGGPIIHPSMNAISITPICPQTISMRPLVVPSDSIIEVKFNNEDESILASFDGQESFPINNSCSIKILLSDTKFKLANSEKMDYFDILRTKLGFAKLGL